MLYAVSHLDPIGAEPSQNLIDTGLVRAGECIQRPDVAVTVRVAIEQGGSTITTRNDAVRGVSRVDGDTRSVRRVRSNNVDKRVIGAAGAGTRTAARSDTGTADEHAGKVALCAY